MKKTKKILFIILSLLIVMAAGLLAACGDDTTGSGGNTPGGNTPGGNTPVVPGTFVAEAEYTNLQGVEGSGQSGGAGGTSIIQADSDNRGASNGYYISYLQVDGVTLTFNIVSDKAATAKLVIRVSIEQNVLTPFSPEIYRITVNAPANDLTAGEIEYTAVDLTNGAFVDVEIGIVNLVQGTNRIRLTTIGNELWGDVGGNSCAAPIVDCIKLSEYGDATLSWSPRTQNIG